MTFDCLLFDLDGTLVDSVADLATGVNLLRGELRLPPLPIEKVRSYVGDGATMLVRRSLGEELYERRHLERFLTLYGEHLLESTALYPGIEELLEAHRGRKMAVVTNKPIDYTEPLLEGLGLRSLFASVVGGDSCHEKKPHPAPVLLALEEMGVGPASAVMIGDHHTDLKAGAAAGVKTCFCSYGFGNDGGIDCDYRVSSPSELLELFPGEEA